MLYDKRWDKQITTDPLSLESLIAWLEKQPADATYCFTRAGECLLAQYFRSQGFERALLLDTQYLDYGPRFQHRIPLPAGFNGIAAGHPRTFGAALERARAAKWGGAPKTQDRTTT